MGFLRRVSVFIFFTSHCFYCAYGQQKETVLTKKIPPAQLKADAELLRNIVFAMHPVIGIYQPKSYYTHLFSAYLASLTDSLTEKDFRIKTKLVADELHCGHTEVIYSKSYYKAMGKQKLNYSPYIFIPVQNKVYVLANLNKKQDTTLKRGMEITTINGITIDSMLRYCKRFISTDGFNQTSKSHYLQLSFNTYYMALFGRPDTFRVEYKDGASLKNLSYAAFRPKTIPPIPLGLKDDSLFTKYKRASMRYRYLDKDSKTLLLKIDKFSRKRTDKAYRKIFRKLRENKSENLVVDLRNNGGGSLENSYNLLSYLMDTVKTQTLRTSIKNYPYRKYTQGNIFLKLTRLGLSIIGKKVKQNDTDNFVYTIKPRRKNHFNKKIIVLINGGSFSASCIVAAYLKKSNRAIFIGEETGGAIEGCNAGITPYYTLPNTKIKIRMPAFRVVHDVAPTPTGHGILPDYKIEYSIKDILAKKDLELAKAKELLEIN
jgi:hypothetical protein